MKRRIIYMGLSMLMTAGAVAAPLTPEEAYKRVLDEGKILNIEGSGTRATINVQPRLTLKSYKGVPSLYVFEKGENNGFMVVSADDCAAPLLGYSDMGTIDPGNMPPALEYWLDQYQMQIEYARENSLLTRSDTGLTDGVQLPSWAPINPLVKTKWNQDYPYNALCPVQGAAYCYTGCVATAMAQVMKYFQFPAKGRGKISYAASILQQTLELDFSTITFDWGNMLDSYNGNYNNAQASAVATLMKACGYSVQMDYSSDQSGTVSSLIGGAMIEYFDYDKGANYHSRDMYTYSDWAKMVYDNLKNIGPVLYDGQGKGGGHSFVIDGYQGSGYFHLNWGWSGMSDGYYLLDALSPAALGAGGGLGGYNFSQGCWFGIQPNLGDPSTSLQCDVLLYGNFTGIYSGGSLTIKPVGPKNAGYGYQGTTASATFLVGVGYVNSATPNEALTYVPNTGNRAAVLEAGMYIPADQDFKIDLDKMNLTDGVKYKVVCAYRDDNNTWHQMPTAQGYYNYFYLTKNGSKYTVDNLSPMEFTSDGITFETDLYYNSAVKVSTTLHNPNNTELSRSVSLALLSSTKKIIFLGDSFTLTLPANGTAAETWATTLSLQTTSSDAPVIGTKDYYPALYDVGTGTIIYQSPNMVTMKSSQGTPQITASTSIQDAPLSTSAAYKGTFYDVENAADFNIVTDLTVRGGYFTNELYAGIYELGEGQTLSMVQMNPVSDGMEFITAGESKQWITNINFQSAEIGKTYWYAILNSSMGLIAGGISSSYGNQLDTGFVVKGIGEPGAVESIYGNAGEILFLFDKVSGTLNVTGGNKGITSVEAYYLNGMRTPVKVSLNGGNAFADLSGLGKGAVIVKATDGEGKIKSIKIVL